MESNIEDFMNFLLRLYWTFLLLANQKTVAVKKEKNLFVVIVFVLHHDILNTTVENVV